MQYTVYKNTGNPDYSYLLDVQSDIIDVLETRLVIPLFLKSNFHGRIPTRLCPTLNIDGNEYLVMTHAMASIRVSMLGDEMTNVSSHRQLIKDAMDLLFDGF
ncbi:CcdB family protein [Xenorhabdus nematophila]|uniref:Toxin CcdB n=1 Tax=Xenorhabdus nematophila (strain ATCC 19061 / DSM 3370 / CCUG 14189 / LMG 1036 / NCIMB 9965 / AN6) TaxID=406817 RepID=D3VG80_XENNA|nr:CcdB family protein [Xenorhabdus nematophila]CEE94180.1 Cytotoxic protein CcdB [Xenorhabdus nematophila str. Anatoliense]CEF30969.1 Cytotoxic protein CcdB [Xenorhabdus nematophila str. Websteri]AYA41613.1 cytotoxin [Xenorhabdus nematophila]KHD28323.1 cytotoxin [Xenorhabdus nematophila]MBA0020351.1 CcdB family protein [Xenorhabdus nematophila]